MVTTSVRQLLAWKQNYLAAWPGGVDTMPPQTARAYRNLLAELSGAGKRNQGTLPGIDMRPVAPEDQGMLL